MRNIYNNSTVLCASSAAFWSQVVFLKATAHERTAGSCVYVCECPDMHKKHTAICTVNMGWGLAGFPPASLETHQRERGTDKNRQTDTSRAEH